MIPGFRRVKPLQKEKTIDAKVRAYGISKGLESVKLTMLGHYGTNGYPDRMWLLPGGGAFFMEMKRPGGVCTERQLLAHARLRALGFHVYVVETVDTGRGVIDTELGGLRKKRRVA